jgi:ABC-type glycerol-3-phosphate transport system permease component
VNAVGQPAVAVPVLRRGGAAQARRRRLVTGYLLCLPAVAAVLVIVAWPIAFDVGVSLTDASGFEAGGRLIGLANYAAIFSDPEYWEAARNTLLLVGLTAALQLTIGVLTALLLWWKFVGRSLIFLVVFIPWAFPSSFSAFAWYWLMTPPFVSFYTHDVLQLRFFLEGIFGNGAWAVLSIALMSVWRGSSIIAIFALAGFNAIPEELLDYGRLEARSAWRFFWRVMVPLNRRFLLLGGLVAVVISYLDFVSVYVETGGRITFPIVGTQAYMQGIFIGRVGYAAALTVTQLPIAILLAWLGLRWVERSPRLKVPEASLRPLRDAVPAALRAGARSQHTSGWWRWRRRALIAGGILAAVAVFVFHIFPLYYTGVQAVRPLNEFPLGQTFWAFNPEWDNVVEALNKPVFWQWSLNTLIVFGVVLVVSLTASLMAGYGLARFRLPGAPWLARAMFCAYFVPQMAVMIPIFQVYGRNGLDNTLTGIILLYLTLTVPFATWLFYAYFQGLDSDVEEHAMLDGDRWQAFRHVVLPMSWPVVIAAGLFAIGMMGSDIVYASSFTLTNESKTLVAGLGITAINLDEWANVNASILAAALPIVVVCAALGRYFVEGLRAALIEGA